MDMTDSTPKLDLVLDVDGTVRDVTQGTGSDSSSNGRPWIGIHFQCCGVYTRVYRRHDDTRYEGRCPKCAAKVSLRVGPDGVASRTFTARPI